MALTTEQQAQVDIQNAIEDHRNAAIEAAETRRNKLEMVRLAKEIIVTNQASLPVADRDITASSITTLAESLYSYIKA